MKTCCAVCLSMMSFFLMGQPVPDKPEVTTTEVTQDSPVPEERTVQFSVFVWSEGGLTNDQTTFSGVPRVFYDAPGGVPTRVPLYLNRSSPMFTYQGPQPLTLYDVERAWVDPPEDAPPDTQPTLQITRTSRVVAKFPEGLDRAMIILFPSRRQGRVFQSILLPYGTDKVRPGMSRILNGTDNELALKFSNNEDKVLMLKPGRPFDFTPGDYSQDIYPRIFLYGLDATGRLRLMHTNRINFGEESTNFFIVIPEGVRRVRIKSLGSFQE